MFKNQPHYQEFVYDFSADAGAIGAVALDAKANKAALPVGAIVKSVVGWVEAACTSGGSAVVSWGNPGDVDGYSGVAIAVASLTVNSLFNGWDNAAALLWDDTNDHQLQYYVDTAANGSFDLTIATAALTAGRIVFMVEYYMPA